LRNVLTMPLPVPTPSRRCLSHRDRPRQSWEGRRLRIRPTGVTRPGGPSGIGQHVDVDAVADGQPGLAGEEVVGCDPDADDDHLAGHAGT